MFQSNGVLAKSFSVNTLWEGTTREYWPGVGSGWNGQTGLGSYAYMYRNQHWVAVNVNKIADASARLPLKVYERGVQGRPEAHDHPYARLLRRPSETIDPFLFWKWTVSTLNIEGEAFWLKIRDNGGRPVSLAPWHPSRIFYDDRGDSPHWYYRDRFNTKVVVPRRDLVHFRLFNPDGTGRGMSPMEPLRSTLENEEGARRANSAMWRNGARPSVVLEHPKLLNNDVVDRLTQTWRNVYSGVDNWAKSAVLEEGMHAQVLPMNVEELQYIEARKLNREEVCAAYDVPPPVVHILDKATYSNITEQMRSMYRDTMAPKLGLLESTLDFELRDGRLGEANDPDFSEDVYAEFLMDEVMRGAFEARAAAYQAADYLTMAEKREMENRPYIEGTDHIFLNAATLPLGADGSLVQPAAAMGPAPEQLALPAGRSSIDPTVVRSLLGRLGRCKSLDELDLGAVVPSALIGQWQATGSPIEAARAYLAALLRNEEDQ